MTAPVVTRFAPSPTGYLHIGGARTALFNWLFARANGGTMLLRIEDTDRERSTEDAIQAIKDGLTWLGLDWDGDAVSQYSRVDRHREVVQQLLDAGHAYHCYCSPEELTAMRELANSEGRPPRYDGRWRDRPASDAPDGVKPVVRFKSPQDGETIIADRVQGEVTYANDQLDDLIILRSDGNPTYNLSVVVDDHDMGVTHIVRGVDHLTNAARQSQIYKAMGWDVPVMAHIPLIHGADGAKLSKRHGALGVEAYRDMGYLPQAMRNYLARLGWSHGDDEVFSTEQMLEWFTLDGIGKSAARFDFAKLENLNGLYMRDTADSELLDALVQVLPHVEDGSEMLAALDEHGNREKLLAAMPGLKERAKTLIELQTSSRFLFAKRPLAMEEKAVGLLDDGGRAVLAGLLPVLEAQAEWRVEPLEQAVRDFATEQELKLGKVAQPLRAALTGSTQSPPIFDVLAVLGREEALGRLKDL
ncbi:glutamate--tRNA ligase [Anderseniella sp. Alg231-50]|uniref:glutamate--tRNA ligase n=1 Tax=Anderseniella sp. Alg231-50 TaxID=1922226 RepID=UPI000D55BB2B